MSRPARRAMPLAALRPLPPQAAAAPTVPLDHPSPTRAHRVYVALTNHCNRSCPWCSTYSSPAGSTFLPEERLAAALPTREPYELQLEGGEPMLHPSFWRFVEAVRADPRCRRLVVATNGTCLPRDPTRLDATLARLGHPLTIKLSYNHHLRDHDPGLLALAVLLRARLGVDPDGRDLFVLNVRLRRGAPDDDADLRRDVEAAGLGDCANVFFLERYGLAADRTDWQAPMPVWGDFRLINPDGSAHGTDLVARSEAMGALP